jgi:hypothetical protein
VETKAHGRRDYHLDMEGMQYNHQIIIKLIKYGSSPAGNTRRARKIKLFEHSLDGESEEYRGIC